MHDHTKPTIFKGIIEFGTYFSNLCLVFLVTSSYLYNIAHVHIQETQLKINTLLESIHKDVSLERSSESEDKNAPGMCKNNYTYVPTYICIYIHVYKIAIVMCVRYIHVATLV